MDNQSKIRFHKLIVCFTIIYFFSVNIYFFVAGFRNLVATTVTPVNVLKNFSFGITNVLIYFGFINPLLSKIIDKINEMEGRDNE